LSEVFILVEYVHVKKGSVPKDFVLLCVWFTKFTIYWHLSCGLKEKVDLLWNPGWSMSALVDCRSKMLMLKKYMKRSLLVKMV